MSELELIKDILRQQLTGYQALREVLQKERGCLIDLKASEIEELSKKKDLILMSLRLLEEERLRIIEGFRNRIKTEKDINLRRLFEITGDEEFLKLRSELLSLIQAISELNDFNRILIDRSLSYVRSASFLLDSHGINAPQHSLNREA